MRVVTWRRGAGDPPQPLGKSMKKTISIPLPVLLMFAALPACSAAPENAGESADAVLHVQPNHFSLVQVAAGANHACAIMNGGLLKCWGINEDGQLGLGDKENRGDGAGEMGDALPYVDLGTGRKAKFVSPALTHTCAILDDGSVKCWGKNDKGQLGLGHTKSRGKKSGQMGDALKTVDLGKGRSAKAISAGFGDSTCVILDNDRVKCWGNSGFGQLGLGDLNNRGDEADEMGDALPYVDLGTGRTAKAISNRSSEVCALLDNNAVKCWGLGGWGGLGLGDPFDRGDAPGEMGDALPAVDLGTGRTAIAVASGWSQGCAILDNGSLKCWGYNDDGELGLGDVVGRGNAPGRMGDALPTVNLGTGRTAKSVSIGVNTTCVLLDDLSVKCWGVNRGGDLGSGSLVSTGSVPSDMGDGLPAVRLGVAGWASGLSVGGGFACASSRLAGIKCWGSNTYGQLGQGDVADRGDEPGEMGPKLKPIDLGK